MTSPQEESSPMRIHQPLPTVNVSLFVQYVRTVAAIALLAGVWYLLFVWGLLMTESWLVGWNADPASSTSWQAALASFLQSDVGLYLPASGLVLLSIALFFYRTPRAQGRLYVPIEFGWTTLLFLSINQLLFRILHALAEFAPLLEPATGNSNPLVVTSEPTMLLIELGWVISVLMLIMLFWLQGSGALHSTWRRRQTPSA